MKVNRTIQCLAAGMFTIGASMASVKGQTVQKPRYLVVEGRGWSACEGYAKLLNTAPRNTPHPICEQHLDPHFPELTQPDWEDLDIWQNLDIAYAVEKNLGISIRNAPLPGFDAWRIELENREREGKTPRLRTVRLALAPDSPVETVIAYEPDRHLCHKQLQAGINPHPGGGSFLYLFKSEAHTLDTKATLQFAHIPMELLLFQGKALLFSTFVGSHLADVAGHIFIEHLTRSVSTSDPKTYLVIQRCRIRFDFPSGIHRYR